jgi:UDP-glucuronate 4-epimerase
MQPGDVVATSADVSALAAWTGLNPGTPLRQGIQRFADWYRDYHRI